MTAPSVNKPLKNGVLFVLLLVVANFLSSAATGFLAGLNGNVELVGLSQISFDPLITIAYIILYDYIAHFFMLSSRAKFNLFLFTLFLSFTMNFIQGSILLILLLALLRKAGVLAESKDGDSHMKM